MPKGRTRAGHPGREKAWNAEGLLSPVGYAGHLWPKYLNFEFPGKRMLNLQEGGRLDAKRHYVILAKALDGI